ncbi:MAG: hypothetical protein J6X45_04350 [Lachnospiraceae bacterium]|nr:hypothetical protein [Lachnospiraceae bacterium]
MGELRHVDFGRNNTEHTHEHHHEHTVGPNEELVNFINSVANDLKAYNEKVAKITHQEHLLHN